MDPVLTAAHHLSSLAAQRLHSTAGVLTCLIQPFENCSIRAQHLPPLSSYEPWQIPSRIAMQYRVDGGAGFWRNFGIDNQTQTRDVVYLVESVFHEMMLQVRVCRPALLLRQHPG